MRKLTPILLLLIFIILGCESNNIENQNTQNHLQDSIEYYLDYNPFTGELLNKTIKNDIRHPFIEATINNTKPSKIKLYASNDNTDPREWIIHFSETGKQYSTKRSYDGGIYGIYYTIPMGNQILTIDITDKGMRGTMLTTKTSEDTIINKFKWFRYVDFKLGELTDSFIDSVINLNNHTHEWHHRYVFSTNKVMMLEAKHYDSNKNLQFQNNSCYDLNNLSFFWWCNNANVPTVECDE